ASACSLKRSAIRSSCLRVASSSACLINSAASAGFAFAHSSTLPRNSADSRMKSRMLLALSRLGTVHPIRSATRRPNSVIASSEQVGNVSTWHLLQLRIPLSAVRHIAGRDVALVLAELEVEASLGDALGVPALRAMRNDPVEREPAGIGCALDLGRLREALPPPVNPRFPLDGLCEASTAFGRDLPNASTGRLVPELYQPLGRHTAGVQLFGDKLERDWFLGRSRPIARDGRQSLIMIMIILLLLLLLLLLFPEGFDQGFGKPF